MFRNRNFSRVLQTVLAIKLGVLTMAAQDRGVAPPANLMFSAAPADSNWFVTDQELASESLWLLPDGTTSPLRNAAAEARTLTSDANTALGGGLSGSVSVPNKLANVNEVMDQVLRLGSAPQTRLDGSSTTLRLLWNPKIAGVVYQQVMSNGTCSDIPLYEDYNVTLRYEMSVNLDLTDATGATRRSTPLRIELYDPSPVYVHTRCWKQVNRRNTAVIQRQTRSGTSLDDRVKAVQRAVAEWLERYNDDFEDDVLAKLQPNTGADGKVKFDGVTFQVTESTPSRMKIRWTFAADELTRSALAGLSQ